MPAKIYTTSSNFQYRWSLQETKKFLGLLKRYPILYHVYVPGKAVIIKRRSALNSLLKECNKARLNFRDRKALLAKINIIKSSFASAFVIFKKKSTRNPHQKADTTLPWFDDAHFLDTTGFIRKIKQKWTNLQEKESPATESQPVARSKPTRTLPRRAVTQPKPSQAARPRPLVWTGDRQLDSSIQQIKLEAEENAEEQDTDREEGEMDQEEEDDDEYEQGEFIPEDQPHQRTSSGRNNRITRIEGNVISESLPRGDANYLQQQQTAARQELSTIAAAPVQRPPPPPPCQTDYFHAFLEYAKLRTQDYTPRQKREIMNAVTNAMNRIDEEVEAIDVQDYSIQMFSSLNEYSNTPKE